MEKFLFLTHDFTDPYFNLASEEYLLKLKKEFFVYLWIDAPSVIVGVNQNALQEVNLDYTDSHGIKVVRRLTGGGAVYHDLNNLCYTVIAPYSAAETENYYVKFTAPVINYLNSLGVKAEFSGRNDICIDGKKISGNAQTVFGDRIMHHGTILFDTDADTLAAALKPNKLKTESKGIKSARARITNVREYLPALSVKQFRDGLAEFFGKSCEKYSLTQEDISAINALSREKYSSYEWNIGRSPKGKNVFEKKYPFGILTFNFNTEKGRIVNAEITGDFFSVKDVKEFAETLNGVRFVKYDVKAAFKNIGEYISGADGNEIANDLFG
ncbi:MAG: lipoate--protein ligase [Clostridia bacterium]|nr:lipoate--protein ligase [Clostridia bacterium]